ncbi:MAG: chemotaxis protein CheD [Prevotellaceae bacterium]|nr:chemotaxis protein CheD [Prevotellaceae bacterium]
MGDLPKHLLYPADIFVDKIPHIVSTVLGSCISVCLYDPVLKLGAINHFILPQWNGHDLATMKYGNLATIRILEELLNYGSQYENLVAKIFGGADALTKTPTNFHIGKRNAQMALEILDEFRIPIVQINTGGNQGRKIGFNTYTGEVEHLFIRRRDNQSYSGSSGLLEGFLKRKEILLSGIGNPPQK